MDQIYEFSDWTSASRMKNKDRPELKIDVAVLTEDKKITGYHLSVYDKISQVTFYAFDINREEGWSLSSDQAIEVLNRLGFPCRLKEDHYSISDKVKNDLESLYSLGFSHITKDPNGSKVFVSRGDGHRHCALVKDVVKDYNYFDYCFLRDNTPTLIGGLLSDSKF